MVGPNPMCSYKRGKFGHRDTHTARMLGEHQSGGQNAVSAPPGTPEIASQP